MHKFSLRRLRALVAAGLVATASLGTPQVACAADGGDIAAALMGLVGSAGMYGMYLNAILDAGNNAIYQEQTRLHDEGQSGRDKNEADNALVDRVMTQLIERGTYVMDARSLPFQWQINKNNEFNAACFPTDHITINRGLLRSIDRNEEELASVLAHEMSHGLRLHAAYTYARAAAQSFGVQFLGMATGTVRPDVAAVLADYSVAKNIILPIEYEADKEGFYLAASAGFNPGGAAAAMARMRYMAEHPAEFDRSYGADAYDHPDTDKREAKLSDMMTAYSAGHVTVRERRDVYIDDTRLVTATWKTESYDDTPEQAYLIAGGLAKAFHDHADFASWQFRAGENGRIDYLTDDRAYRYLKEAVAANHADAALMALVEAAYAREATTGARQTLCAEEAKRVAFWEKEQHEALTADAKLITRMYKNADWYNDLYRPQMAIFMAERALLSANYKVKEAGLYAVRGRAHAMLGDFVTALQDTNHAVALDPKDAYTYLNRADVYRAMGRPQDALLDVRRALEADKKTPAAWKMAGDIEDELGDEAAAKRDYREYIALVPRAYDIEDKYLKELNPKIWKEIEKERAKAVEERKKELEKKREKDVKDDTSTAKNAKE